MFVIIILVGSLVKVEGCFVTGPPGIPMEDNLIECLSEKLRTALRSTVAGKSLNPPDKSKSHKF